MRAKTQITDLGLFSVGIARALAGGVFAVGTLEIEKQRRSEDKHVERINESDE